MNKTTWLLTPKNLYRLLTGRVFWMNDSILSREKMRGLTLIGYWRNLLSILAPQDIIEHLFPSDSRHPRAQTGLMNRSSVTSVPLSLRSALDERLSGDTLLSLIQYLSRLLINYDYKVVTFDYALTRFENDCFRDDPYIPPLEQKLLTGLRSWTPVHMYAGSISPQLFKDAARLAFLSIFSLYGTLMNCEPLARFCVRDDTQTEVLWQRLHQEKLPDGIQALDDLPAAEKKLMRLLALLPHKPSREEDLRPLCVDIDAGPSLLAEHLAFLAQKGLVGKKGGLWALPPELPGIIGFEPFCADEFPLLWKSWADDLAAPVTPEKQKAFDNALFALLRCGTRLNDDALRVLTSLELTAMTRGKELISYGLPSIHQKYLDSHPHSEDDDVTLHIIHMLWALLGGKDAYASSARALLSVSRDALLHTESYDVLCNILEIGGSRLPKNELNELFERIRPDPKDIRQSVIYLNFLGGKQRFLDKDPRTALKTLQEARMLIEQEDMAGGVEEAANDTRTAYCLADLERYQEALPLIKRVMDNLRQRGYTEDSQTMVATRNSYLFFQSKVDSSPISAEELWESIEKMRNDGKTDTEDYCFALQHYADMLTENGDSMKALEIIREALSVSEGFPDTAVTTKTNLLLRAGKILYLNGRYLEALGHISLASIIGKCGNNDESELSLRCMTWSVLILIAIGREAEAETLKGKLVKSIGSQSGREIVLSVLGQAGRDEEGFFE